MHADLIGLVRHEHLGHICEDAAVTDLCLGCSLAFRLSRMGQVVGSEDHVLCRGRDRGSILRCQNVVHGQHEESGFCLCLYAERNVYRHLVSVEVRVERCTSQRMELDRLTFDQYRLECLNTKSVQGRRTVQHNRMFSDDLFEDIPYFRADLFDHSLGALDVVRILVFHQLLHDERLEQLQRHLLRKTALIELQFRADNDYGTA